MQRQPLLQTSDLFNMIGLPPLVGDKQEHLITPFWENSFPDQRHIEVVAHNCTPILPVFEQDPKETPIQRFEGEKDHPFENRDKENDSEPAVLKGLEECYQQGRKSTNSLDAYEEIQANQFSLKKNDDSQLEVFASDREEEGPKEVDKISLKAASKRISKPPKAPKKGSAIAKAPRKKPS